MSKLGSDLARGAARLVVAVAFAVSPSRVPAWRTEPLPPPGRVLPIGRPVTALVYRQAH